MDNMVNLVVKISPRDIDKIFSSKAWFSIVQNFSEISGIKDNIQLVIFFMNEDYQSRERFVVGYFAFPKYAGTAVHDHIEKCFIFTSGGNYESLTADEGFAIKFPVVFSLPYLPSKRGQRFWQIDNDDALKILNTAYQAHRRSDDIDCSDIITALELIIEEIDVTKDIPVVSSKYEDELKGLPEWLKTELLKCKVDDLPITSEFTKALLARSKENPKYCLQAAALQLRLNDYKYILSLANYCYSVAYQLLSGGDYQKAFDYFIDAADLYQMDPKISISDSMWKVEKRLECITTGIKAQVIQVLVEQNYVEDYDLIESSVIPELGSLRKYLNINDIKKLVKLEYIVYLGRYYKDNKQSDKFINFMTPFVNSELKDELPFGLLGSYYDYLSDSYIDKDFTTGEDFEQAAKYKLLAVEIVEKTQSDRNPHAKAVIMERKVDYYKYQAIVASRRNNLEEFNNNIDASISVAEELNNCFPTENRKINIHFLKGLKYGKLAKQADTVVQQCHYNLLASEEYKNIITYEGRRRFVFHQLLYFFHKLRTIIGTSDTDFESAMHCSMEALSSEWASDLGEGFVPKQVLLEHKGLHLSIIAFDDKNFDVHLKTLAHIINDMESTEVFRTLPIVKLIYGIQLIRSNGINAPEISREIVKAIRSAIKQILNSGSVSQDNIIDDLVNEKERLAQQSRETEILSRIRCRRLVEDFSLECKQFVFNPSNGSFVDSILETAIAFLNSPSGGEILVGIKDGTYEPFGIDSDVVKYKGSLDQLKQAIFNHIRDGLHADFSTFEPGISISFPEVEGKTLLHIKVPSGPYKNGLYVDKNGIAYIKKDGHLLRVISPVKKDELAQQRRKGEGIWRCG